MGSGILTSTLNAISGTFMNGFALIWPSVQWLMWTLAAIEIVLIAMYWALSGNEQILSVFKKILFFGFWLWLIQSFPGLMQIVLSSFANAGLTAGGQSGNLPLIWDPSRIAGYGMTAVQPILTYIDTLGWKEFGQKFILGLSVVGILAAFFVIAIQVFVTLLEFYLVSVLVLILLPFGFLSHTKFLAEKALGGVISFGIKIMVLAFIVAAAESTLSTLAFSGPTPTWNETFSMVLISAAIAFLAWNAPGIAAGLLTGSPSLTAGTAAQNTVAGALMGGAAAAATVGAVRAAATAGGTLSAGATRLAGAASTGYQLGSATSTGGALAQAGSGVSGGLKSSANALIQSTLGRASSSVGSAAARNFSVGSSAGYRATGGTPSAGMKDAADAASAGASGGGKSAPAWAQRALHAMHAVPQEARPSGGGALPKL